MRLRRHDLAGIIKTHRPEPFTPAAPSISTPPRADPIRPPQRPQEGLEMLGGIPFPLQTGSSHSATLWRAWRGSRRPRTGRRCAGRPDHRQHAAARPHTGTAGKHAGPIFGRAPHEWLKIPKPRTTPRFTLRSCEITSRPGRETTGQHTDTRAVVSHTGVKPDLCRPGRQRSASAPRADATPSLQAISQCRSGHSEVEPGICRSVTGNRSYSSACRHGTFPP